MMFMTTLNETMQKFCKAKAMMTYLMSDDPIIDESVSRYENWALAYDLFVSIGHLDLEQVEQIWNEKTHTNFVLWGVVGECSIEEIVSYVTEEYDAQAVTLAQINELQDGKTLAEI